MENLKELNDNVGKIATTVATEKVDAAKTEMSADITKVKEDLTKTMVDSNTELQKSFDDLTEQFKSINIATKKSKGVTIGEDLNANKDGLLALRNKEVNSIVIKLDENSEVVKALSYGGSGASLNVPQEMRDNELKTDPHYQTSIAAQLAQATSSNTDLVRFIREETPANAVAGKAHGAAFAEKVIDLRNRSEKIVTIGEFVTLDEEQLSDVAGLRSFVTQEFMGDLTDLVDRYILRGTGGGNNQLNGFGQTGQNTAWADSASFTVAGANNIDVLMRAMSQLEEANYTADTIIVNPADFWGANFILAKSSQNEYVARQILSQAMTGVMPMLGGAKIIRSNAVTSDAFYVMDSKKAAKLWTGEGMEIEFSRNGNDFQNNQISGRIKCRKALTVGRPNGIILGDFSTARGLLAT